MTTGTSVRPPTADVRAGVTKRLVQVIFVVVLQAAILFLAAGTLDWLAAWVYLAVYLCGIAITAGFLIPRNPELVAERGEVKADAKGWDKLLSGMVGFYLPMLILLVAGFDKRLAWSAPIDTAVQLVAFVVTVAGFAFLEWAIISNAFFSGVVRIQKDRGHRVASGGPYRFVRHPGYVGMLLFYTATTIFLGSWWGLVPALVNAVLLVIRTHLEDRTLQAELEGYRDYAQRVRYRLLPGVW